MNHKTKALGIPRDSALDRNALIKEKYGAEPNIQFFETPVVVDNVSNEIVGGANAAA